MNNFPFLQGLFPNLLNDHHLRAWICSFAGDPTSPNMPWNGHAIDLSQPIEFNPSNNNFAAICALKPVDHQYRRAEDNFAELHVVMLDDVGSKIPESRIVIPPTWRLETSPANFQHGYLFDQPLRDVKLARTITGALCDRGFSDRGAGQVIRYFRLPEGANGKQSVVTKNGGKPFRHVLHDLTIDRRYAVEAFAEAFGIDLKKKQGRPPSLEELTPHDDPIFKALERRGLFIGDRPSRDGWWPINCPWSGEHEYQSSKSSTAYKPGGAFKCLHTACANRRLRDLVAWLREQGEDDRTLLDALPVAHRTLALAVSQYVYVREVKRFIDVDSGALVDKEALSDYHAHALRGGRFADLLLRRDDLQKRPRLTYRPGRELFLLEEGQPAVNEWRPGPIPIRRRPEALNMLDARVRPWLDHLAWLFDDEKERALVLDFLTHLVRARGDKINFALMLMAAEQGTGRDTLLKPLLSILDTARNVRVVEGAALERDFNSYVKSEVVYMTELDTSDAGRRKLYKKLKAQIVTPPDYIEINIKNVPEYQVPNVANYIVLSNDSMPLILEHSDRRFAVARTRRSRAEREEYKAKGVYRRLHALYDEPGWMEDFASFLVTRPIVETFEPKADAPLTAAKRDLLNRSETEEVAQLRAWLDAPDEQTDDKHNPFKDRDLVQAEDVVLALGQVGLQAGERQVRFWLGDIGATYIGRCVATIDDVEHRPTLYAVRDGQRYAAMRPAEVVRLYLANPPPF